MEQTALAVPYRHHRPSSFAFAGQLGRNHSGEAWCDSEHDVIAMSNATQQRNTQWHKQQQASINPRAW